MEFIQVESSLAHSFLYNDIFSCSGYIASNDKVISNNKFDCYVEGIEAVFKELYCHFLKRAENTAKAPVMIAGMRAEV
jgi:hypothetical protein